MNSEYFIHIIESPGADDFLANRQEGHVLRGMLELMDCRAKVYTAVNQDAFAKAVQRILEFHAGEGAAYHPMLHISCHGNQMGIAFTDNAALLSWKELAQIIKPLSEAAADTLLVGMSTCHGYEGLVMAESNDKPPYAILVGPKSPVKWSASAVAFCAYYFQLTELLKKSTGPLTEEEFRQVISNMNAAAGLKGGEYDAAVASVVHRNWQARMETLRQILRGVLEESPQQQRMMAMAQALRSRGQQS
jgi:hypothetical protein